MGVGVLNPQNLVAAYGLVRMQEENMIIMRKSWRPSAIGFQGWNLKPTQPRAENKPVLVHRLTPAQTKEKRDKGLCFKCDNKWKKETQFKEGEWVYLRLQPYWQSNIARNKNGKLAYKYFGSFKILKKVREMAY